MRFVCFEYINETAWGNLPDKEQQEILQKYSDYYQHLKTKDRFLGGTGLKGSKEACKLSLIDNTVKETNLNLNVEQLGGFFFLEANNLQEAKTIVAKHPGLKVGTFEIRVVDEEITEMVGAK
jgi:hypothetical protein